MEKNKNECRKGFVLKFKCLTTKKGWEIIMFTIVATILFEIDEEVWNRERQNGK